LDESTVCTLIRFKLRHPAWGPKKIRLLYARQFSPVPSVSSCQRVLTRAGLVLKRPRRHRSEGGRIRVGAVAKTANDVWTVDFKGWWLLANGQRCEPLTVRDAYSRFLLGVYVLPRADTTQVRAYFETLFARYGLPRVIKSDNGAPFATSQAPWGLSRLSAWWLALGIELDRSRPAHPQDNGAHERLHRDIQAELSRQRQPDAHQQQAAFDLWREQFNWERPHEALGGRCPGEIYQKSPRALPAEIVLDYGVGFTARKISKAGVLSYEPHRIFVSGALAGWPVGLRACDADRLELWFAHVLLGHIELSSGSFLRAASRPQEAAAVLTA
jgi:transposase InsO family protein